MTFDTFTFCGEFDMLEIRFNLLDEFVDHFLIVEAFETFSGNPKPFYWQDRDKERFKKWENKVIYIQVYGYDHQGIIDQINARDYVDANSFKRAFFQKEVIRLALEMKNPDDEDIVYFGDVDEVWRPQEIDDKVYKLRQLAYSYYLNNRSPEDWRGTIVTKWKNLKNGCLNDMRANPVNILENGGWHFTNLGGHEAVMKKLESYDHTECNIPFVTNNLKDRMDNNEDFLGRGYKMWIEDKDLPSYILENKDKWIERGLWKTAG